MAAHNAGWDGISAEEQHLRDSQAPTWNESTEEQMGIQAQERWQQKYGEIQSSASSQRITT